MVCEGGMYHVECLARKHRTDPVPTELAARLDWEGRSDAYTRRMQAMRSRADATGQRPESEGPVGARAVLELLDLRYADADAARE